MANRNIEIKCNAAGIDFHISTSYAMYFISSICMNTIHLCRESEAEIYANVFQLKHTIPQYDELINSYCGGSTTFMIDVVRANAEFISGIMKHCVETQDAKALVFLHYNSDQNKPLWKLMIMALEEATRFLNPDTGVVKFRIFTQYNKQFAELMTKSNVSEEGSGL